MEVLGILELWLFQRQERNRIFSTQVFSTLDKMSHETLIKNIQLVFKKKVSLNKSKLKTAGIFGLLGSDANKSIDDSLI